MNAMSNTVKSKFAGMLFGWLRHVENKDAGAPTPAEPRPPAAPAPSRPDGRRRIGIAPPADSGEIAGGIARQNDQANRRAGAGAHLHSHRTGVAATGDRRGQNRLRSIARSRARICFEWARNMTRFSSTVPLNEVLARLNPKLFARSPAQTVARVSDEITSPFSARSRQSAPDAAPTPGQSRRPLEQPLCPVSGPDGRRAQAGCGAVPAARGRCGDACSNKFACRGKNRDAVRADAQFHYCAACRAV